MTNTPENWPYHEDGSPYDCELCDLTPYECQCPNGPWNDIDSGIKYLLGEHNSMSVEIELAQSKLDAIQRFINAQAEDESLWCEPAYVSEMIIQKALRGLHAYVESVIKDGPRPETTKNCHHEPGLDCPEHPITEENQRVLSDEEEAAIDAAVLGKGSAET